MLGDGEFKDGHHISLGQIFNIVDLPYTPVDRDFGELFTLFLSLLSLFS